jgi:hypothetical protein
MHSCFPHIDFWNYNCDFQKYSLYDLKYKIPEVVFVAQNADDTEVKVDEKRRIWEEKGNEKEEEEYVD